MTPLPPVLFGREFSDDPAVVVRHILAVALSVIHLAAATYVKMSIRPFDVWSDTRPFLPQYRCELSGFFLFDFVMYWAILGLGYAFEYRERYRERESLASQLRAQLAQAQLESLKMQLHPHFLFNTLHAISGLVRAGERSSAVNMIAGLSELLRRALDSADEQEVPLRDEIKFVELYLDIQKVRFSDRLKVRVEVSPDALDALVPNLILQPLVENAIRHGVSQDETAGAVVVNAYRSDATLHLSVCDDGPGLQSGWRDGQGEGIGLANTRERLERLYGPDQRFDLRGGASGGDVRRRRGRGRLVVVLM